MTPGNVDIETLSKIMSNIGAPNWSRAKQVDSTTNVYDERPRRMSATDVCDGCLTFIRITIRTDEEYNEPYAVKNNFPNCHCRNQHRGCCMDVHTERPTTNH